MNERIKELARQCDAYSKDDEGPETKIGILIGKEIEKFAELIVQECANFVREEYDHEHAEGIAWTMEVRFGLHGDYA